MRLVGKNIREEGENCIGSGTVEKGKIFCLGAWEGKTLGRKGKTFLGRVQ